jgi:hypothetical protein
MKKVLVIACLSLNLLLGGIFTVSAQLQTVNYSASDPSSYQCFNDSTGEILNLDVVGPDAFGNFYCEGPDGPILARIKPPTFQQIEVWFVRILYAVWGLVVSLSFLFLVKLGYDYMISRGDVTKITEIRKRIVNYVIGFALVFLSVPILTTVFRLLGVNDSVQCYNVNMPGFQFFYTSLCTDPKGVLATQFAADPCQALADGKDPLGVTCRGSGKEGQTLGCNTPGIIERTVELTCDIQSGDQVETWCKTERFDSIFGTSCSSTCKPSNC